MDQASSLTLFHPRSEETISLFFRANVAVSRGFLFFNTGSVTLVLEQLSQVLVSVADTVLARPNRYLKAQSGHHAGSSSERQTGCGGKHIRFYSRLFHGRFSPHLKIIDFYFIIAPSFVSNCYLLKS